MHWGMFMFSVQCSFSLSRILFKIIFWYSHCRLQATRSNFPFDKVSDIAQALPKHSVTFVERKLFVKPNEEIVDVPSKISAMPPMEITTDKNMPSSTTETNIGMTTDENVDTFTDSGKI